MVVPGYTAGDILVMHTLRGRPQLIFILYLNITLITLQTVGDSNVNYINIISPLHHTNQNSRNQEPVVLAFFLLIVLCLLR